MLRVPAQVALLKPHLAMGAGETHIQLRGERRLPMAQLPAGLSHRSFGSRYWDPGPRGLHALVLWGPSQEARCWALP